MATHPRSLILQFLKGPSQCRTFSSASTSAKCSGLSSSLSPRPRFSKAPTLGLSHAHASLENTRFFTSFAFSPTPSAKSRPGWYKGRESSSHISRRPGTGHGHSGHGGHGTGNGAGVFEGFRRWFNKFPTEVIVWGIIGINGAVYFAWQYATDRARFRDFGPYSWMTKNMAFSLQNIREGRIWTILTSTFSHTLTAHILVNCISFYYMAPPIIGLLGNTSFMGLYLFGGIACSALTLLMKALPLLKDPRYPERYRELMYGTGMGASGAIYSVMSFFACVSPQTKFYIFFVLPLPAWAAVGGVFLWDGITNGILSATNSDTRVGTAGHMGGILAGAAFYLMKRRLMI